MLRLYRTKRIHEGGGCAASAAAAVVSSLRRAVSASASAVKITASQRRSVSTTATASAAAASASAAMKTVVRTPAAPVMDPMVTAPTTVPLKPKMIRTIPAASVMPVVKAMKANAAASAATTAFTPLHIRDQRLSSDLIRMRHTNTIRLSASPVKNDLDLRGKRDEIRQYFHNTFDVYEKLFDVLIPEKKAFTLRADRLRHPLIFYFGHTATFFINKLIVAGLLKDRVNPAFESLFAVGVDEMSWDDLLPDQYDQWPTHTAVKQYRDTVRAIVDKAITNSQPVKLPIGWTDPLFGVLMCIEHERIHLETSSVLIRQLPLSVLKPADSEVGRFWARCQHANYDGAPANSMVNVIDKPQSVTLGKPYDSELYGWDNEYGTQHSTVAPFDASRYLVTNAEFKEFVDDGGYTSKQWWTDEGWRFAQFATNECKTPHPRFWIPAKTHAQSSPAVTGKKASLRSSGWRFRTMLEEIEMPWDWPVETNQLEAKAFCNWKAAKTGKPIRLPTEDEYRVMRLQVNVGDSGNLSPADPTAAAVPVKLEHPYWSRSPANLNLEYYASSVPVNAFPKQTSTGLYDVVGNVWQHTETPIDPFQGFRVHEWYDDFSLPTFDLAHNLLMGGSWISTGNEAVTTQSRYAFRRHFYQHAGFRYIQTERPVTIRSDVYERDSMVETYLAFHYGKHGESFGVPNFAKRMADIASEVAKENNIPTHRALDMGCAVGRTVFELARTFDYVIGLDFSARFIRKGVALKDNSEMTFEQIEEGDLTSKHSVTLKELGLESVKNKVEFFQGDACNLDPRYTNYDLITAVNLIDRLYDPKRFLSMIHTRLRVGGLLVVASPYTWLAEYTPRENWIGGFIDPTSKQPVTTLQGLTSILGSHFELVGGKPRAAVPFIIRETARKYQHTFSEVTVWRRVK